MKTYLQTGLKLTKSGIVFFSYICSLMGYFLGQLPGQPFIVSHFVLFSLGFILLAAGSCALNQVQESDLDSKMQRTSHRPIPSGQISWILGFRISLWMLVLGILILFLLKPFVATIGLLTLVLYNGCYTLWWKKQ